MIVTREIVIRPRTTIVWRCAARAGERTAMHGQAYTFVHGRGKCVRGRNAHLARAPASDLEPGHAPHAQVDNVSITCVATCSRQIRTWVRTCGGTGADAADADVASGIE